MSISSIAILGCGNIGSAVAIGFARIFQKFRWPCYIITRVLPLRVQGATDADFVKNRENFTFPRIHFVWRVVRLCFFSYWRKEQGWVDLSNTLHVFINLT